MWNNTLENLELKLINTKLENSENLDKIEKYYQEEYWVFLDEIFQNSNLWFKRFVWVDFQLNKLNNNEANNHELFKNSFKKAIQILPIDKNKKLFFETSLTNLLENKNTIEKIFLKNKLININHNFPILESLKNLEFLNENDLLKVSLEFKQKNDFIDAIWVLSNDKKDLIKKHYYELNNTKKQDRIKNFENDFSSEIKNSKNITFYPKVLNFIWKNYFKLRLKNKIETKKQALRRVFKIVFLKLYRLKNSWIDIKNIINKIDNLHDLESMLNLVLKFFEQLKQNPNLQKDYIVSDEVDELEEIYTDAEENKDKTLFLEEKTIKANKLLEKWEKYLNKQNLDTLLDENIDLVGDNFVNRNKIDIDEWIKANSLQYEEINENEQDSEEKINLEEYIEKLKLEFEILEKKKNKLFLDWDYDKIDDINEQISLLIIKLEKISKIIWDL